MNSPFNPRESLSQHSRWTVIRPEFREALFQPTLGATWARIIPPHAESRVASWLYDFQVYDLAPRSAGFVPEIVVPGSLVGHELDSDPVRVYGRYVDANYPHLSRLCGPQHERPVRIFPRDRAVCWAHIPRTPSGGPDTLPVRLWYGSAYRGNKDLRPGPLRVLEDLCSEEVPTFHGKPTLRYGDISHPDTGRLITINVERDVMSGFRFQGITVDEKTAAPIADFARFYAAHPLFGRLNVPIEETIVCPRQDQLFEVLENYLGWQVRNGYAGEEVYEAFACCFGREVSAERRVAAPARSPARPPASMPSPTLITPAVVQVPNAAKPAEDHAPARTNPVGSPPRIRDDLDEFETRRRAAPATPPSAEARRDVQAATPPARELPDPLVAASRDELIQLLRRARATAGLIAPEQVRVARRILLAKYVTTLTSDDFQLINAFSSHKFDGV